MNENELKALVGGYLHSGKTLNEIHKILVEEYKVKMTFMDLRILSAELEDMDWSIFDPKKPEVKEEEVSEAEAVEGEMESGTIVELHKVQRPGAMVSGSVVFLSGIKGEWYLDRQGSLGLNLDDETRQPDENDMRDFQMTLRRMLQGE